MAEASRVLASSLDYAETLQRVARLAVPQIADWCAVDSSASRARSSASRCTTPTRLSSSWRNGSIATTGPRRRAGGRARGDPHGRSADLHRHPPDALAALRPRQPSTWSCSARSARRAVIIVPMIGAAGPIGAITLVSSESSAASREADLAVAERLGRRAGTAVENARLYTERSRIAHTLQQALLPESLPEIPGAEIQARYCAAGELNEVGGDFYDVLRLRRRALDAGDRRRVRQGSARRRRDRARAPHAARGGDERPNARRRCSTRCTRRCAASRLERICAPCAWSTLETPAQRRAPDGGAGRPSPAAADRRDGQARPIGRPGTLLGVLDRSRSVESERRAWTDGETLLLYTDGVPEAGRSQEQLGEDGSDRAVPPGALASTSTPARAHRARGPRARRRGVCATISPCSRLRALPTEATRR